MYNKYANRKSKLRKLNESTIQTKPTEAQSQTILEVDETISISLKAELSRTSKWEDVLDLWRKTIYMRQNDISKSKSNIHFIEEWPKLKDARAPELVRKNKTIN